LQKDEEGTGQDGLAGWSALNAALEARQPPLPLIFGHHDLLPANLIDDGARLWLIDYEYAGFGTCLFDLAGAASNAGMDRDQALALIRAYLGRPPSARFLRAFDGMQVASLLREMLWARVSARHLKAPGVDYAAYAAENEGRLLSALEEYQTMHGRLT
jgi:thiamine kinase-like enzyme